jgi:nucleoside-diphosphate-sugar epimerase
MAADPPLVVAVTGASGYVGGLAKARLDKAGYATISLGRAVARIDGGEARQFDLRAPVPPGLLAGIDVLVHAAWDLRVASLGDTWRVNVEGSARLFDAAAQAGVARVVFISSMSAHEGTTQPYGLAKLECERQILGRGGVVIRPGLVYGGSSGMAAALTRLSTLPLVPLVAARARQFTIHEDDLAEAIAVVVAAPVTPTLPIGVAHETPIAFQELLASFAAQQGKTPRFVPFPWPLLYGALRAGEIAHLRLPFRSDSLLGLVHPAPEVPNAAALHALGVQPRPFPRRPPRSAVRAGPIS